MDSKVPFPFTPDDCVRLLREISGKPVKRTWGVPRKPLSVVASEMARDLGGVRDDGVHAYGKRFVNDEDHVLLMWDNREGMRNPVLGAMLPAKRVEERQRLREMGRAMLAASREKESARESARESAEIAERVRIARLQTMFGLLGRGWVDDSDSDEDCGFVLV